MTLESQHIDLYLGCILFKITLPKIDLASYLIYQNQAIALNDQENFDDLFDLQSVNLRFKPFQDHALEIDALDEDEIIYQRADFLLLFSHSTQEYICFFDQSLGAFEATIQVLLQKLLADRQGFLIHASCAVFKHHHQYQSVLIPGVSGAGKSTSVRYGAFDFVLTDEMSVIIKGNNQRFYSFSSPFWSEDRVFPFNHYFVPLQVIAFPIKDNHCVLIPKPKANAYMELMQFVTCYQEQAIAEIQLFHAVAPLIDAIDSYDLYFSKPARIVDLFSHLPI